jgi:anionic cell wall polymer biosynthesis LytR-Cps2A-Psr (LCP) family protein
VVLGIGLALMLVSAVGIVGLRVLVSRYERAVAQERLLDEAARQRRTAVSGPLNYLLIGSDLRANDPESGQRADTIVIAHIPAGLGQAYLVSIPRDLRVEIPGHGTDKINASFAYGRAQLSPRPSPGSPASTSTGQPSSTSPASSGWWTCSAG